ncbi:unnamed protein product [Aspergillus oryzae]|uniref:Unnamed protein product n=2 Tax=Aspergillus oryzae TaxID=5062 RepID=A0AAN5BU98_ASPOZ|nr:unnamed protein product [Aspergillus oryzae]GMF92183.1 unnamed protein product [Aspergillus oryzae]GMG15717.1 unnamed protein product [Aspergillus oryzae]GMG26731.1 unnamed protein product [Aspergillus oryzae]GMG52920.1 unnamed protein product [Aspergillus oryzae var. brunneus]
MNSREHSDMPPTASYPSPNAAQMGQGAMQYYANRQLTADELLSAELSRETSGPGLADGSSNGVHHGQSMVLGSSNPGGGDMGRPSSPDQHQQQHMLQFTPSQQVGVDPNHDLSYGDQSARRKRSKISRACDECRRKKVLFIYCLPPDATFVFDNLTACFLRFAVMQALNLAWKHAPTVVDLGLSVSSVVCP